MISPRYSRHPYPLSNFLAALVLAQQKKQSQLVYYKFTKAIQTHAEFLYKHGYIYSYSVNLNYPRPFINTLTVNLKYSHLQLPLIRSVHFYSSPSRAWWVGSKEVSKLIRRTNLQQFVISTSFGVLTAAECASKKLSGLLLYRLN